LICIDPPLRCGLKHQIPRGRGDLCVAEPLPELDVEIAAGESAPDYPGHDQPIRHLYHYAARLTGSAELKCDGRGKEYARAGATTRPSNEI
jgi:hypothetical protein